MNETFVMRLLIVVYVTLSGFVVWLLLRNSAHPDNIKNSTILLASILPAVIAISSYLISPQKIEKHFTFSLFYDNYAKRITLGNDWNVYSGSYIHMFANVSEKVPDALKADTYDEIMELKGMDLIENGILQGLMLKFLAHWDIAPKKFRGPSGCVDLWTTTSKLSSLQVQAKEIQEIFKHNPLIQNDGIVSLKKMYLPPRSKIRIEKKDNVRSIFIENSVVTVKIDFFSLGGTPAQRGVWGVFPPDNDNINRYQILEYAVESVLSVNDRTKTYSPEMKHYQKWFENICNLLSQYDWEVVDRQIEKTLNREVISKSLGLK